MVTGMEAGGGQEVLETVAVVGQVGTAGEAEAEVGVAVEVGSAVSLVAVVVSGEKGSLAADSRPNPPRRRMGRRCPARLCLHSARCA